MSGQRRIEFDLSTADLDVVNHVLAEVASMLEPPHPEPDAPKWAHDLGLSGLGGEAPVTRPSDPAVARLLPDGSRDDPLAAGDFRRLTEPGLRLRKQETIALAAGALHRAENGHVVLDDLEAAMLLRALTDVRLVMAQRLGLDTDEDAAALHEQVDWDAEQADESLDEVEMQQRWLARAYDFLTHLQQFLADLLLQDLPEDGDGRRTPPDLTDRPPMAD